MTSGATAASASASATAAASRHVVIHVFDEFHKTSRDFTCARGLLLDSMRYFRAFLTDSNARDEIDISVHCDVDVFELLVEHMHRRQETDWRPRLSLDNVASILVSSEFLQMDDLVGDCARFIGARLQEFVLLRVDLSCLSGASVARIADQCRADQLHQLQDPKDKIRSKLQRHKVDGLVKALPALELCACCDAVYSPGSAASAASQLPGCWKSSQTIGRHGELSAPHQATAGWRLDAFLRDLAGDAKVGWTGVYWYLWAATNWFDCVSCRTRCSYLDWKSCAFHPGAVAGQGADAKYACCGSRIFSADAAATAGCSSREHAPVRDERFAADESMTSTLLSVWDQVARCAESISARSNSSRSSPPASLSGAIDAAAVYSPFPTSDEPTDAAIKRAQALPAEASSSACRKQWRILQRQERDRIHMQQLARRLLLQRKSAAV